MRPEYSVVFLGMAVILSACSGAAGEPREWVEPKGQEVVSAHVSPEEVNASFEAGDCHRCHVVPDRPPTPRLDSCTNCHLWIRDVSNTPAKRAKAIELFPLWERYERNVATYLEVPSLPAAMARVRPAWMMAYLRDPYDLRPRMNETMPRFNLTDDQINAIGFAFQESNVNVPVTPRPTSSNVQRGGELFQQYGCGTCHTYGGLHTEGISIAPDLIHVRERLTPDMAVAWIKNPSAVSADAVMANLGVSESDAIAIRDYLYMANVMESSTVEPMAETVIQPTSRPVTYSEVRERVFGKICVHCHMDPVANGGRMGPGNEGGFGWPATGIELETYEGIAAVAEKIPDAILRRRKEAPRDSVSPGHRAAVLTRPEKPGMPLGLPPLSDEDISLILGWLEQGMPR